MTTRDMNNDEAIQMLNRCKHEITQMRTELDYLRPKAEAYDNLKIALSFARTSQGYGQVSEDLVHIIQKRIDELTPKPEANPVQTPTPKFNPDRYSKSGETHLESEVIMGKAHKSIIGNLDE